MHTNCDLSCTKISSCCLLHPSFYVTSSGTVFELHLSGPATSPVVVVGEVAVEFMKTLAFPGFFGVSGFLGFLGFLLAWRWGAGLCSRRASLEAQKAGKAESRKAKIVMFKDFLVFPGFSDFEHIPTSA